MNRHERRAQVKKMTHGLPANDRRMDAAKQLVQINKSLSQQLMQVTKERDELKTKYEREPAVIHVPFYQLPVPDYRIEIEERSDDKSNLTEIVKLLIQEHGYNAVSDELNRYREAVIFTNSDPLDGYQVSQ